MNECLQVETPEHGQAGPKPSVTQGYKIGPLQPTTANATLSAGQLAHVEWFLAAVLPVSFRKADSVHNHVRNTQNL